MTGYGKAEAQLTDKKITIEIKTLNSKSGDIGVKLPPVLREKEMEFRQILANGLERGKIDCNLNIEYNEGISPTVINKDAFISYTRQLNEIAEESGLKISADTIVQAILRLPEAVRTDKNELSQTEWDEIMKAFSKAVSLVNDFRGQEGKVIGTDFKKQVSLILEYLEDLEKYEKSRIEKVKDKLMKGLDELKIGDSIDKNRFEQELIYYLEKMDVSEEKSRLRNHCSFFLETLAAGGSVGRKLSFIAQEMGREINTLGSKANDHDMQQRVVKMKDELEKIKEQTANVL